MKPQPTDFLFENYEEPLLDQISKQYLKHKRDEEDLKYCRTTLLFVALVRYQSAWI